LRDFSVLWTHLKWTVTLASRRMLFRLCIGCGGD
jgi:hypothetical protein